MAQEEKSQFCRDKGGLKIMVPLCPYKIAIFPPEPSHPKDYNYDHEFNFNYASSKDSWYELGSIHSLRPGGTGYLHPKAAKKNLVPLRNREN